MKEKWSIPVNVKYNIWILFIINWWNTFYYSYFEEEKTKTSVDDTFHKELWDVQTTDEE